MIRRRSLVASALAVGAIAAPGCGEERRDPVVVRVELEGAQSPAEVATGFVVARERVVTVAHVLEPTHPIVVRTSDGRPRHARLLGTDRRNDLALIAVPGLDAPAIERSAGGAERLLVRRGARTRALHAVVRRRINARVRGPEWGPYRRPALELAARVGLGDSGAPLVDSRGRVAGVLFARASNGSATAYAVAASALGAFTTR